MGSVQREFVDVMASLPTQRPFKDHAASHSRQPMLQHVKSTVVAGVNSFPAYLQRLDDNFGRKFIATLFSAYFGGKGALLSFIG